MTVNHDIGPIKEAAPESELVFVNKGLPPHIIENIVKNREGRFHRFHPRSHHWRTMRMGRKWYRSPDFRQADETEKESDPRYLLLDGGLHGLHGYPH